MASDKRKNPKFQSDMKKSRSRMIADDRNEAFINYSLKIISKAKTLKRWPTQPELDAIGVDRNKMRYHYEGTLTRMAEILSGYAPNVAKIVEEEQIRVDEELHNLQGKIIENYLEEVEKYHHIPNAEQLKRAGFKEKELAKIFSGGVGELEAIAKEYFDAQGIGVYTDEQIDNEIRRAQTKRDIQKYERLLISSISKSALAEDYFNSSMHYCKKNSAKIFLLPTKMSIREIDVRIRKLHCEGVINIVFGEVEFHKYFHYLNIAIEDKVVEPLAGLARKMRKSAILASPKQHLDVEPSRKAGFPLLFMTPGAMTVANYRDSETLSTKRARMAENDHIVGAVILEKEGDLFFARQTQSNVNSEFVDWGMAYSSDMENVRVINPMFVMGDLHSIHKHKETFHLWLTLNKALKTKGIVAHDIFDASSCNPHEGGNILSSMMGVLEGTGLTKYEVQELIRDINLMKEVTEKVYVVDSNHDDMLLRAFKSRLIWNNPNNAVLATFLYSKAMLHEMNRDYTSDELVSLVSEATGIEENFLKKHCSYLVDKKPLLQTLCEMMGLEVGNEVIFMDKRDSLMHEKYQMSQHGDKGINGAKGSLKSFARIFSHFFFGHTHTESQRGHVASVGHCEDDPRYARGGFSKWTRSSILSYGDCFQQIRSVFGRIRTFKGAYLHPDLKLEMKDFINTQKVQPNPDQEIERKRNRYVVA